MPKAIALSLAELQRLRGEEHIASHAPKEVQVEVTEAAKLHAGSNNLKRHQPKTWDDRYRAFIAGQQWQASRHPASAGMQWRTEKYEELYKVIETGKRVVVFVYYQSMDGRDICTIKSPNWEFSARGIGYGSWAGDKPTVEVFVRLCE